jgi:hypothetical protein
MLACNSEVLAPGEASVHLEAQHVLAPRLEVRVQA